MNDTQLLERLTTAYATVPAPTPSTTLAELMESGGAGRAGGGGVVDDERDDAVVVPLVRPRTPVRMRHLVAALVATFVLFGGLAVAGALPDSVQRQVSSVVSHLGIDLPSPAPSHGDGTSEAPRAPEHTPSAANPSSSSSVPASGATGAPGAPSADGTPAPATAPGKLPPGGVGTVTGGTTATTVPAGADELLPPLTVPQLPLPPVTVPQLPLPTLPPVTVPTLPTLPTSPTSPPLPPLPVPLPFDLPAPGL